MSASSSGVKKSRAPRVPYTPPAARRSAASNKVAKAPTTHDADRSEAEENHVGSPAAVQPAAEQERVGASTGSEENIGGEILERTGADTCKPTRPSTSGGVDRNASPAAKVVSAGSESRRKPRQAWAQYVPPGRRGSARSDETARPSAPESKPSKPTEEPASSGSSDAAVDGDRASSCQQAAQHRTSTAVVADEPAAEEHTSAGAPITTASSLSTSNTGSEGSITVEPTLPAEEGQASVPSPPSPAPSPPPPPEAISTVAQEVAGTAPPVVHQESQGVKETSPPHTSPTVPHAVETPRKEPTTTTATTTHATKGEDKEDQELPPLKPPAARYIPPGRRKALDAEAAAGGSDGAAGDGMGPLWTSRAPVRVSQRERATDKDASAAARPAPVRVAGVVSGGMSAYGANISEYSGELVFVSWCWGLWATEKHRTDWVTTVSSEPGRICLVSQVSFNRRIAASLILFQLEESATSKGPLHVLKSVVLARTMTSWSGLLNTL